MGKSESVRTDIGTIGLVAAVLAICAAAPAMAEPPTPFMVCGNVLGASCRPCNARNESESNYYQIVLTSGDVSANDTLQFVVVCGDESTTTERNVTQDDLDCGGFVSTSKSMVKRIFSLSENIQKKLNLCSSVLICG